MATPSLLFSPWRGFLFPFHFHSLSYFNPFLLVFFFTTLPSLLIVFYPTSSCFSNPYSFFYNPSSFTSFPYPSSFTSFPYPSSSSPSLLHSTSLQPQTCIKGCNVVPLVQSSPGSRAEHNCPDWRRLNSFLFSSSIFRR